MSAKVLEGNKKGFWRQWENNCPPFHDHTWVYVVMEGDPSTTTCTNVVVKDLRLDSYLHVMPPRFSSTTNIGFLVVNYGRERPIF